MESYPFTLAYRVPISDINYGGHVSNAAVLTIFQEARIAFLQWLGGYSELSIGEGCGIILPEAHVLYRAEMFHQDQLEIGVRIDEIRRSSFVMAYRVERDGVVTAEGTTNLVCFDYEARKTRRLPETFGEAVRKLHPPQ